MSTVGYTCLVAKNVFIYIYIHTLYGQKYLATLVNYWIQVFQSDPLPQVYKIKHLAMHSICKHLWYRICRSEELSDFKHGTVIGCRLCNKTVREISSLLEIPLSTVSDIIRKWKRLVTTTTQPRSGRPCQITEQCQRLLRRISRQRYADSIAEGFWASTGIQLSWY